MSKEASPTLEDWKEAYNLAIEYKKTKFWEIIFDDQIFGVENPEDGNIGYCCIMGAGGTFIGIAIYLGDEGFNIHRQMIEGEIIPGDMNMLFSQKCLMVSFESKEDLEKEDKDVIKKLSLKLKGKFDYPIFRSYEPGFMPWFLNREQVKFATICLEQILEVYKKFAKDKKILNKKKEHYLVRYLEKDTWQEKWVKPNPFEKLERKALIDISSLEALKKFKALPKLVWEMSFLQMPTPIMQGDRPYYPYTILILDKTNKMVLTFEVSEPNKLNFKLPSTLTKIIKEVQVIPEKIHTQQKEVKDLLELIGKELKIKVEIKKKMKDTEEVLNGMLMSMMGDMAFDDED